MIYRMAAAALMALALVGCATVRPVPVALPLPARPTLTPVPSQEVACLAPAAYTALVSRERALRTWGLALEAIIKANNVEVPKP